MKRPMRPTAAMVKRDESRQMLPNEDGNGQMSFTAFSFMAAAQHTDPKKKNEMINNKSTLLYSTREKAVHR